LKKKRGGMPVKKICPRNKRASRGLIREGGDGYWGRGKKEATGGDKVRGKRTPGRIRKAVTRLEKTSKLKTSDKKKKRSNPSKSEGRRKGWNVKNGEVRE